MIETIEINGIKWIVNIEEERVNRRGNVSRFGTGYKLGKRGKGVGAQYNVSYTARYGWQLLAKNNRIR